MRQKKNFIAAEAAILMAAALFLGGCAEKEADAFVFTESGSVRGAVESLPGMESGGQDGMQAEGWSKTEETCAAADGQPCTDTMAVAGTKEPVGNTAGADSAGTAGQVVYTVHVCGAVACPGVYELPEGSRVTDAVEAGGGFLEEADPAACNLAQPVTDGCQIYIPTKEEGSRLQRPAGIGGIRQEALAENAGADDKKVNLNTADLAALKTLPGIGDSRAAAILAWRQENGLFSCIEDIMKVSGIKQAAFEKIRDRITV